MAIRANRSIVLRAAAAALAILSQPAVMGRAQDAQSTPSPDMEPPPAIEPEPVPEQPAEPAPAPTPAPDIAVVDSQLLAILTDPGGTDVVTPTTAIPYVVGRSCYNWALKYQPVEGELTLSEELILPGPARNWGTEGGDVTEVNAQGSGAVTRRRFDASTGTASAGWCVAKDDPVGSYRYIIRQGEREIARFDFTVGDLL
ncbi:MAG: hypothetical protein ABW169_15300 [Sphingobium sp.]